MAILIPSQNIYQSANKKIIDNAMSGVELEVNKTKNNTNLKDYFNYSFAKSLDVDTEGQWGMEIPKTDLPENTEYFWTEYEDISQTIYKAWQKFYFEIIPEKYFTNVSLDNLFGNIIFSVSQSRIAGDLRNGEWIKNEGISGDIVSEFTLRDRNASGFTTFSAAIINEEPNSNNIKNIVQQIEKDYRSATLSYSYVYFTEISKEKIKGSFLFPVGVDARSNDILQTARYSHSSSVVIKMKIGELEEENIVEKIGDNTNFLLQSNELMQSSNTYQISPYPTVFMQNVIKSYKNGKETATILCSISDYFEYNASASNFKGEKVIAIDNSTGKMSFKMYDQVIPMVYGANGKDYPMSLYKDGTPKVFQVLGTKIYYDGAVWQELSLQEMLQEVQEEEIEPLIAPTITLIDSVLNIANIDTRATAISILVDKNEVAKTTNTTFDLSTLNLSVGAYKITAKTIIEGNIESEESNQVIFVVVEENPDEPEIEKPFEIDTFIVDDGDYKYSVFDEYGPIIEEDENGNKLFYYDTLALIISSANKTQASDLLWLASGEKITIYPFDMGSSWYENSLNWIYRLTIKLASNGATIKFVDINGGNRTVNFGYWNDTPVTIDFYIVNGIGTIKVTDKDGYGSTATNVDFSYGVTISSN